MALDAVTLLDGDAKFRHKDWTFPFAAEFGRAYTTNEEEVMAVDAKVKGSVKLIEIPGGNIAMLPAGGGASVYYSDAVVARGGKLANYAEYSGDPPDWAVEVLTEKICSSLISSILSLEAPSPILPTSKRPSAALLMRSERPKAKANSKE